MRNVGHAINEEEGMERSLLVSLEARLCFPGLLWMLRDRRDVGAGRWRALFLRLYSGGGGNDGDDDDDDTV